MLSAALLETVTDAFSKKIRKISQVILQKNHNSRRLWGGQVCNGQYKDAELANIEVNQNEK